MRRYWMIGLIGLVIGTMGMIFIAPSQAAVQQQTIPQPRVLYLPVVIRQSAPTPTLVPTQPAYRQVAPIMTVTPTPTQ